MALWLFGGVVAILGGPTPVYSRQAAAVADPTYEVSVMGNVMVPMRDGVRLATDIFRPAMNGQAVVGKFPVILGRTPYNKTGNTVPDRTATYFVQNGYVYINQDLRGRYASEGSFRPFGDQDVNDGYDVVVWITKQPWSNGKVATMGASYGGLTQLELGLGNPPGLVAQVVQRMWDNAFKTGIYTGGAFEMRRLPWPVQRGYQGAVQAQRDTAIRVGLVQMEKDMALWLERFPAGWNTGASPLKMLPEYERFLVDVIGHWTYDDFWKKDRGVNIEEHWDDYADVPVYWIGGWYDIYAARSPIEYMEMSRRKTSPQRLIMGPWCHCATEATSVGSVDYGPATRVYGDSLRLVWFNQFLKGMDTGTLREAPVRIFVMGTGDGHKTPEGRIYHGGEWRSESDWPLARAKNTAFYFHGDHSLATTPPAANASSTTYTHDPENPVPTVGGQSAFQGSWTPPEPIEKGAGGFDQRDMKGVPLRQRPDVVVFETAPLGEAMEVTGPITVKLFASSSAVNTDFTAKLIDVYPASPDWPEGYAMIFQDGIIRASHRESMTDISPLVPGKVYEFTIAIPPTSNVFKKGHRIRVDIASSNYPRFDLNPGTMDPPFQRRGHLKAENRVYHDRQHASHVVLPVVP
ncbi:MAG: CocE/NonD family hydrolase [Gemmatimonadetes bacterium]|nr:CocE/NonD family hydrolase [Gemmatimonadota bacterium]